MSKNESPDALSLAKIHAGALPERNTDLFAMLSGARALLEGGDNVNGLTLLDIAIDRVGDVSDFQGLSQALSQLEAGHE